MLPAACVTGRLPVLHGKAVMYGDAPVKSQVMPKYLQSFGLVIIMLCEILSLG